MIIYGGTHEYRIKNPETKQQTRKNVCTGQRKRGGGDKANTTTYDGERLGTISHHFAKPVAVDALA